MFEKDENQQDGRGKESETYEGRGGDKENGTLNRKENNEETLQYKVFEPSSLPTMIIHNAGTASSKP